MGYSLGIVAAEATRHPRVESGAVSLEHRHLDQYLPRWPTWVPHLLIERAVVARRQPVSEPDLLAADDAMRTQSAHAAAGAAIIAAGSLWSILLFSYGDDLLGTTARQTLAALLPAVAWVVGIVVQNLAWRVRRLLRPGPS